MDGPQRDATGWLATGEGNQLMRSNTSLYLCALTVIVLANVVVTIALWLESARRTPQFKLKKKFINQLLSFSSKPITPKHQPSKSESLNPNNQRFLDDFADFANIINARF